MLNINALNTRVAAVMNVNLNIIKMIERTRGTGNTTGLVHAATLNNGIIVMHNDEAVRMLKQYDVTAMPLGSSLYLGTDKPFFFDNYCLYNVLRNTDFALAEVRDVLTDYSRIADIINRR